jgi:hypothetical protein
VADGASRTNTYLSAAFFWRRGSLDLFFLANWGIFDALQGEAVERAVQGWLAPVFYRGRQCGAIRHHSDRLLAVLLKAWMPEKYCSRRD